MKHIVSFSGGRTSAYLVHLMEQKRINGWDVEYVFMDTGAEHPKTYEFIKKCVDYFSIELTVLKIEVEPELGKANSYSLHDISSIGWDLSRFKSLVAKYGNPYNPSGGYCTDQIKTQTYKRYLKNLNGDITSWLGIRMDEPKRLKERDGFRYLAELSQMHKSDIIGWWAEMPFDLQVPEFSGNCVFCIKKSPSRIALAQRESPELFDEWNALIKSANPKERKFPVDSIYRGKLSFEGIANLYKDTPTEYILKSIRRDFGKDNGCGSESCEAFSDQMDMFNGELTKESMKDV
jgi:hypothetical protein